MSAPTPGPWKAGLDAVFAAGHQIVIASTWGVGGPGDRQEAMANGRLIAAAPDLKALADSILIYTIEGDEGRVWLSIGGVRLIGIDASTAEASALLGLEARRAAAIAKAEGA